MDNKIKRNLVYLADNLTNLDRILAYLIQNDIISLNERDEIRKEDSPFNQNSELLNVILRKGFPINVFLEILRNTHNGHCADKIERISPKADRKLKKPKILKSVWWPDKKLLIESLHKRKIGDKLLIEILHDRISNDKRGMLVICESADASRLTGMGGVGKTLTATWYGHYYDKEYDHVIWIDSGEGNILKSFESLARDLKIENRKELSKLEEFARKCYEVLDEFKCLWIFDNAESYKGDDGIKDVLPKYRNNFYCLITSRWREWGIENIGYGQISRLELNIFGESESLEFFKENLKQDIKYTEYQLRQLSRLLGNLPLAMQLAVAALNTGNIDLKNYIEKTSTKDLENIVDTKFDDYEKTINGSVSITLELIGQEECGAFAKEVLNVFGYIRPDNVEEDFLSTVFICHSDLAVGEMAKAIKLLTKYSVITKVLIDKDLDSEDEESESGDNNLMSDLSIHRLLQQVIRHNGRENEKETLRKIFGCKGFLGYKLLPFTKYADEQLRNEYPAIKAELLDQWQLRSLVEERRFEESVELAKFIHRELRKDSTKFNYAICLEMNGQLEDNNKVLEEMYSQEIEETNRESEIPHYFSVWNPSVEMGMLKLDKQVTKDLVGGHLLISLWKMNNKKRMQEILEERRSFKMITSEEMLFSLLRILNSNLIQSNYTFIDNGSMTKIVLDGETKRIKLKYPIIFDLLPPLPNDLQELILSTDRLEDINGQYKNMMDFSEWLPKKLNTLEIYHKMHSNQIINMSVESISSIEKITLHNCSLSLDSVNRICSRQLKLQYVSFIKNGEELSDVNINEFIDFHKISRLKLVGGYILGKTSLWIDLSDESANMEYLRLEDVNIVSLKSAKEKGSVNIKEANLENCSLNLSILPPSLEKLSLEALRVRVFVSGGIDLPNLKYLTLDEIRDLSHFRSLELSHLYLQRVTEVNVDLLPPSAKIIRMDNEDSYGGPNRIVGGVINLDKLILYEFPLYEVGEMLPHFHPKELVLSYNSYTPGALDYLMDKKIPTIAIGEVDLRKEDFKSSRISEILNRDSKHYLLREGKRKVISKNDFKELCEF